MPASTSRLAYPDVEELLNRALEYDIGARKPFATREAASSYRVRVHNFRTICRNDNIQIFPERDHPLHGRSVYDPLQITVEGPDANGEWWVYAKRLDIANAEIEPIPTFEGNADAS